MLAVYGVNSRCKALSLLFGEVVVCCRSRSFIVKEVSWFKSFLSVQLGSLPSKVHYPVCNKVPVRLECFDSTRYHDPRWIWIWIWADLD
jgi:hypothetical protein